MPAPRRRIRRFQAAMNLAIHALASCLFLRDVPVHGFTTIKPPPLVPYFSRQRRRFDVATAAASFPSHDDKDDEQDNVVFNDFGETYIGDDQAGAATPPPDRLQELIRNVKQENLRKDAQLAKNWKFGNWKVRGFSLDKYSEQEQQHYDDDDEKDGDNEIRRRRERIVHVSKVHPSLTPNQVIVGRTDGSVCFVTLGTQYLTQFVERLTARETSNATIQVQNELVPSEDIMTRKQDDSKPFQVERQFMAHETPIVALATVETTMAAEQQHYHTLLFTASQDGNGDIRAWALPDDGEASNNSKIIPLHTLADAHTDTVVALTTLSPSPDEEDDNSLLFSASKDGSLALFDVNTGDLVYKCQMHHDEEQCAIACADVDQSQSIIYLGMQSGHVFAFCVQDMLECASSEVGTKCPEPNGRFMAHEGGVTAVKCAGEGTLGRSSSSPGGSSSLLLTGGADGVVKQWEIMSRNRDPPSLGDGRPTRKKLENWPRLATQRMKRRAHLFRGHHDDLPITALASIDASKFLSAGADGTIRAWSPSTGKELFRMDGFTEALSSLCLQEDLYLITDGMEHYVCVHDFDVQATEIEDGYELEW